MRCGVERFKKIGYEAMNDRMRFVLCVIVVVIISYYAGAMYSFFPFCFFNNDSVGAVGFSTLIICTVIAICAIFIKENK